MSVTTLVTFAFAVTAAVIGPCSAASGPATSATSTGGYSTILWSVLDDCLESSDTVAVCFKSKALTALDRALGKPTLTIADGVSLTARAGKALQQFDQQSDMADRAALDAATDSDQKSALLDNMLANRVDRLVSTRTITLDGGEEGRGKKKEKAVQQALMMAVMTAVAVMIPMTLKIIALMAGKALLISKIALVLSGLIALKKLVQPKSHEPEPVAHHHYGRSMQLDAHDMAYSGQKQL